MLETDANFAAANKIPNSVWKNAGADYKEIKREEQIEWVKSGRDYEAQDFIRLGFPTSRAHAIATAVRARDLETENFFIMRSTQNNELFEEMENNSNLH
ncbi:MAG: hypothetical protein LBP95_12030 [Deltaproteobacteria bacterium]|jgi:hypothetical protein|nr:hypothetical protein [Deltaproteobacteria bacterium]